MRNMLVLAALGAAIAALSIGCTSDILNGTLEGTVYNQLDNPVGRATVVVSLDGTEVARVNCDDDGKYKVNDLDPDTYDVYAQATGYVNSTVAQVTVVGAGTVTRNLTLRSL